jgi:hypothetical protein
MPPPLPASAVASGIEQWACMSTTRTLRPLTTTSRRRTALELPAAVASAIFALRPSERRKF